ncbi:PilZ domain-containing protein [Blastococcus aurantiacus]|uniref:PilZ domain-containing protein n=1 Tax=Blastococcus aurantiacus TaxID=1550231 RepID=A0A1G7HRX4_9ACTN|nr:PilZ domain-containing protein [Blastococcus aurantiacus]SDF03076.1 PilZ domain-containing protein [Blastococcus aurantiacus]
MTDPDANRPHESSRADVTLVTRGITVTAAVDVSTEFAIVVRPDGEGTAWKTAVKDGDPVELYWVGAEEERTLPAKIIDVEPGDEVRWHLVATGPAERSQRRKAVRARVSVPAYIPWADGQLVGETVDLSEAGARCLVDGWGLPPEPESRLEVSLTLGDEVVHLHGQVVRQQGQGPRWLLSMRFLDVPERDGDLLRRRVFQALREERAAAE